MGKHKKIVELLETNPDSINVVKDIFRGIFQNHFKHYSDVQFFNLLGMLFVLWDICGVQPIGSAYTESAHIFRTTHFKSEFDKKVKEELQITSPTTINNYLKPLVETKYFEFTSDEKVSEIDGKRYKIVHFGTSFYSDVNLRNLFELSYTTNEKAENIKYMMIKTFLGDDDPVLLDIIENELRKRE